jgi:hypothetical protein
LRIRRSEGSLLVEGSHPTVTLGFQSTVANRIRCRIVEPVSLVSPSQVAETSRERVTLPSRSRVTNVFAPLRRQRASTTNDACLLSNRTRCGHLPSRRLGRLFSTNREQPIRSLPRGSSHSLFRRVEPHETRNRRTTVPSWRFVVLSANSAQMIGVSVCLADTIRSRRFSRPQRFTPT